MDLVRQAQLKVLAAKADARWAAKESYLDQPEERPLLGVDRNTSAEAGESWKHGGQDAVTENTKSVPQETLASEERNAGRVEDQSEKKDPWKVARGGPSEEWQPAAWAGEIAPRKR